MTITTTKNEGLALNALRRRLGKEGFEVNRVEAVSLIVRFPDIDMTPKEASYAIDGLVDNGELQHDIAKNEIIFKAGNALTDDERIALAVVEGMFEEMGVPLKESTVLDTIIESARMSWGRAAIAVSGLVANQELYLGPENTLLPPNVRMTQKAS